eukprot:jgi/Ulvmu1/4822/UM020_0107.1
MVAGSRVGSHIIHLLRTAKQQSTCLHLSQVSQVSDGKETSVEEATRQFWQRTLGMETAAEGEGLPAGDPKPLHNQPQYPASLRPTIRVLSRLCEQVIRDERGDDEKNHFISQPQVKLPEHEAFHDGSKLGGQQLTNVGVDNIPGPAPQAGHPAESSKVNGFNGAVGYIAAMRKARQNQPIGPVGESDLQAESLLSNQTAKAFLARIRQHSSQSAWETIQSRRAHSPNTIVRQQTCWLVGRTDVQAPAATRPWVILAGPAFAPDCFGASGEPEEAAALEELKNPSPHVGPDVSHLPRPSDKLAFEPQTQGETDKLPPVRKTLADLFDDSMLIKVPPKVVYSGKAISSIDSLRSLSLPALELEPSRHRLRHAFMRAHMKQVEAAALKDQPSGLQSLVIKADMTAKQTRWGCAPGGNPVEHSQQESAITPGLPESQGTRCSEA